MEATIISDQDKGLQSAENILGPGIFCAHCCFHLCENFNAQFGTHLMETYFSKIANAKTAEQYETDIGLLQVDKPAAAAYLEAIDCELWVTTFFKGHCYGHITSNIVESFNWTLRLDRELSVLHLLNKIWYSQMMVQFNRLQEASNPRNGQLCITFCNQESKVSKIWTKSNTVRLSSQFEGEVQQKGDCEAGNGKVYIVNCKFIPKFHSFSL